MSGFFVTGTDTGVGKTVVAGGLLAALEARGLRTVAMKPVASGCADSGAGLRNEDALQLQAAATEAVPYERVNPFAFAPAIAPHLAAAEAGRPLEVGPLVAAYRALRTAAPGAEVAVVEGVGGWRVPLNDRETVAELAAALGLPVVLVVGLRLGCISHALLSAESIAARGLCLAGWVASRVDPGMERAEANLDTLAHWLEAPCLGTVPHLAQPAPAAVARHLRLEPLFEH